MRSKFLQDLPVGKKAEEYVAEVYKANFYKTAEYMFHNTKDYDICFVFPRKDSIKIEVKFDKYANKSGNLCFELSDNKGRKSGVMATKADLMIFMLNRNTFYEFDVPALRAHVIANKDSDTYKIVRGGDNNAFELMLIPIKEVITWDFCRKVVIK